MPMAETSSSAWHHDRWGPQLTFSGLGTNRRGPLNQNHAKEDFVPRTMRQADRTVSESGDDLHEAQKNLGPDRETGNNP